MPKIDAALGWMHEANNKRPVKAPTQEQLNILSLLEQRENLSKDELDRVCNSVCDCDLAIARLNELAHKHDVLLHYQLNDGISIEDANDRLRGLSSFLSDFIEHDTTRVSRIASQYHKEHYGSDSAPLTPRKAFDNKFDLFGDTETSRAFVEAIDYE